MKEKNDNNISLKEKLQKIVLEIKLSYTKNCDKTEYMISLTNMIKEMIKKETLEEYFSNNYENLNYFIEECIEDIIKYILIQTNIQGNNGDEIALDLLSNINKLFIKFHNNTKYSSLFEKIRKIFIF